MAEAGLRRGSRLSQTSGQQSQVSGAHSGTDGGKDPSKMDPEELAEQEELAAKAAAKVALAKQAKERKALIANRKRFFAAAKVGDLEEIQDVLANGVLVNDLGGVGPTTDPAAVGSPPASTSTAAPPASSSPRAAG